MSILNRPSDGLPSVLVLLVRTIRTLGPTKRETLEALVAPRSLQQVSPTFDNGKMVRQTLNRWLQVGLFSESDEGIVALSDGYREGATEGLAGVRALGAQLRQLVLAPENNEDLLRSEPSNTADFTHALCWMLAQDPFEMTTGSYANLVNRKEGRQFSEEPWAFRNDTRWAGFLDWAPLLGFGWKSNIPRPNTFLTDPTDAVAGVLPRVFETRDQLSEADFFHALAEALPVVDGGIYRTRVEARLAEGKWRPTKPHEVSPSLSLCLTRLHEAGRLVLESRADAPHRTLLGGKFATLPRRLSHVRLREVS